MLTPTHRPVPWAGKARKDRLAASLAASLVLHALILSLQFGVYGESGWSLSLLENSGTERSASVPVLQAILRDQEKPSVEEEKSPPLRAKENKIAKVKVEPVVGNQSKTPVSGALAEAGITTGSIREVTPPSAPAETKEKLDVVAETPEQKQISVADKGVSVLASEQESTWTIDVAKAAQEAEEKARNERVELDKAKEAEILERKKIEQTENQRKAELAAIAKAMEDTLARQRIDEEKRATEQAALAKAKEEALARMRIEEEKRNAEQAALAKAREEALAKKAEAEAQAKKAEAEALARREQLAAQSERAAEAKRLADDRGADSFSNPAGKAGATTGQSADKGSSLASRALDQARGNPRGSPLSPFAPSDRQRRGSILGRDPKDIQLAFYGEGWRQKVERIGSLNYPKISKNRHYDPLVVTVSINSDGSLAGVRIDKSSGQKEIDDAVRRILEMSAPFAAFPPDLKRSYDVVDITRTWSFLEERPRIYSQ
ncbi:MAG: cell envelope integrity protein TolA [Proteobacteria bacterium]|nr:cell envelope integrity protein TolA [Pseudomonadota bacterium]